MKLYITRHGTTEWNLERRLQGWGDSPLTADGINRAKLLGKYLEDVNFNIIYSSPLNRALETAKLIRGEKNTRIEIHEALKELSHGIWEGMTMEEIEEKYSEEYSIYRNRPGEYIPMKGESFTDLFERVKSFLEEIASKGYENVLIVSHGITIKALIAIIKDLTWEEFSSLEVYTGCSLNICELKNGNYEFTVEGNISHLDL